MEPLIDYYANNYNEDARHQDAFGKIQELRTRELIQRYLKPKMNIIDVGGATGVYSFFLAERGHEVTLLDIVPEHIQAAQKANATRKHPLKKLLVGDAVTFKSDESFDMIILHGPLYHIIDRSVRIAVLARMKTLLNPRGVLLGFGINRYAGYFYGIHTGKMLDKNYQQFVLDEMKTGIRTRSPGWYFHKPDELVEEFDEAGLNVQAIKSVATQVWMLPEVDALLEDKQNTQKLLQLAQAMEDETAIGQDLLCVGK